MTTTVETFVNATGIDGSTRWEGVYEVEDPLEWAVAWAAPTGAMAGEVDVDGHVSMDDDGVFWIGYTVKSLFTTLGGEPLRVYKVAEFDVRVGTEF